jgi:hypothetical protein
MILYAIQRLMEARMVEELVLGGVTFTLDKAHDRLLCSPPPSEWDNRSVADDLIDQLQDGPGRWASLKATT